MVGDGHTGSEGQPSRMTEGNRKRWQHFEACRCHKHQRGGESEDGRTFGAQGGSSSQKEKSALAKAQDSCEPLLGSFFF